MARIIQNKYPIDTEARRAVGFSLPINGDAVFVPTYETREQVKSNLINYLLTNKGERVFNPNFGADLRTLLFDSPTNDSLEDLRFAILDAISQRFPQITVKEIKFEDLGEYNTINFSLTYEVVLFGIEDTIDILLQ
jgi:phage baseplate assembly protein W